MDPSMTRSKEKDMDTRNQAIAQDTIIDLGVASVETKGGGIVTGEPLGENFGSSISDD